MFRTTHRSWPLVIGAALLPCIGLGLDTDPTTPTVACPQDPAPKAGGLDVTAKSCGACHKDQFSEWSGAAHSQAWTDPIYQADIAKKTRKTHCLPCHIPQSALDRLGKKPKTRGVHKDEGVTCVSCHDSGGVMHGPFGAKTAAHPTAKHDAFSTAGSVKLCASCHRTSIADVIGVARDHEKVYPAKVKKSCIECHMPGVEREMAFDPETGEATGPSRKGRSHRVLGPRDAEFAAKAFGFSVKKDGDTTVLVIENRAGHRVPGLKIRTFAVHVDMQTAGGKSVGKHRIDLTGRDPLPFDPATRDFPLPAAAGVAKLAIRVEHHLLEEHLGTVVETTVEL